MNQAFDTGIHTAVFQRLDPAPSAAPAAPHPWQTPALHSQPTLVLIDLIDARLAFQRDLCRIAEALLAKHAAAQPLANGPTRGDLERLRDDVLRHIDLLERALEELGAVPHQRHPVTSLLLSRVAAILDDPRRTLPQALEAMASAELAESDSWMILADLTAESARHEMAASFTRAMSDEDRHHEAIRGWSRRVGRRHADAPSL
jgi:rubrerythrin